MMSNNEDTIITAVGSESTGDSGVPPPKDQKLEKLPVRRCKQSTVLPSQLQPHPVILAPSDNGIPVAGNSDEKKQSAPLPRCVTNRSAETIPSNHTYVELDLSDKSSEKSISSDVMKQSTTLPVNDAVLVPSDNAIPVSGNPGPQPVILPVLAPSDKPPVLAPSDKVMSVLGNPGLDLDNKSSSKCISSDVMERGDNYKKPYSSDETDAIKSFVDANINKPWAEVKLKQLYDDEKLGGRYTQDLRRKALRVYNRKREALGLGKKEAIGAGIVGAGIGGGSSNALGLGKKEAIGAGIVGAGIGEDSSNASGLGKKEAIGAGIVGAGIGGGSSNDKKLNIGFGHFENLLNESATRGAIRALELYTARERLDILKTLESERGKAAIKVAVSEVLVESKLQNFAASDEGDYNGHEEGDKNGPKIDSNVHGPKENIQ